MILLVVRVAVVVLAVVEEEEKEERGYSVRSKFLAWWSVLRCV
jgi:hypothetical protein